MLFSSILIFTVDLEAGRVLRRRKAMANIPPPSAQEIKSLAAKITSAAEHYAINEGNEASEAALATMQNLARDLDAKVQNPGQQIWFLAYQVSSTAIKTTLKLLSCD